MALDAVELGVDLLATLEHDELSLKETMDRIEAVTEDPRLVREILETADDRGVIEREGATIRPATHDFLRFERDVFTKDGEFDCRRCGTGLSTGYFIDFDDGEVGPFGSSCIRKVTGRDE